MHLYDFKETEKMEMRKNVGSRKWHFQHGKKKEKWKRNQGKSCKHKHKGTEVCPNIIFTLVIYEAKLKQRTQNLKKADGTLYTEFDQRELGKVAYFICNTLSDLALNFLYGRFSICSSQTNSCDWHALK